MWHDNEGFLKQPQAYKKAGLTSMFFPPNSGDLNPIETVWARLRQDLAEREFEDLKQNKVISVLSFKKRVSQLLTSYSTPGMGRHLFSFVELTQTNATSKPNLNQTASNKKALGSSTRT